MLTWLLIKFDSIWLRPSQGSNVKDGFHGWWWIIKKRFCLTLLGNKPKHEIEVSLASKGPVDADNVNANDIILRQPSEVAMTGRSEAAHSERWWMEDITYLFDYYQKSTFIIHKSLYLPISVGLETKSFGDLNSLMISASLTSQIETESTWSTSNFKLPLPGANRIFLTKPRLVVIFLEVLVRTSQMFRLPCRKEHKRLTIRQFSRKIKILENLHHYHP